MRGYRAQITLWEHAAPLVLSSVGGQLEMAESMTWEKQEGYTFLLVVGAGAQVKIDQALYRVDRCYLFHLGLVSSLSITAAMETVYYYFVRYAVELCAGDRTELNRLLEHGNPFEQFFCFKPSNPIFFMDQMKQIEKSMHSARPLKQLRAKAVFAGIIYEVYRELSEDSPSVFYGEVFDMAQDYLKTHYAEPVTIKMLVDALGTSYSTINRLFHQKRGMSAQQFLMELRFSAAKRALTESEMSVGEIALSSGFQDKIYFAQIFKRHFGLTPSAYRMQERALSPAWTATTSDKQTKKRHVVISNGHRIAVYDHVPERIVCLSYPEAEICAALGLEDKIVGIAAACGQLEDCLPTYQEKLRGIHMITSQKNNPYGRINVEDVLSCSPDFIYGTAPWFQSRASFAPIERFKKAGADVYISKATYTLKCTMDDVYEDIINIAHIFDVPQRGALLAQTLKENVEKAVCPASAIKKRPRVFVFDAEIHGMAYTVGMSLESEIIRLAGGQNVFGHMEENFTLVDWEQVSKASPECIIVHSFFPEAETENKVRRLLNMECLKDSPAVRNREIHTMRLSRLSPSIQAAQTIADLSVWLHNVGHVNPLRHDKNVQYD